MTILNDDKLEPFTLLEENLSPSSALAHLQPGHWGVVTSEAGEPLSLVEREDLEAAEKEGTPKLSQSASASPPVILAHGDVDMNALANSAAIKLFDRGARGVVVREGERVTGVLPRQVLDEFIGSDAYRPDVKTMAFSGNTGDSALAGSLQTPLAKIRCLQCGFVNTLADLDEESLPPCQNQAVEPHILKID